MGLVAHTKNPWVEKTNSGFDVEGPAEFLWAGHGNCRKWFPEEPLPAGELSLACSTWRHQNFLI